MNLYSIFKHYFKYRLFLFLLLAFISAAVPANENLNVTMIGDVKSSLFEYEVFATTQIRSKSGVSTVLALGRRSAGRMTGDQEFLISIMDSMGVVSDVNNISRSVAENSGYEIVNIQQIANVKNKNEVLLLVTDKNGHSLKLTFNSQFKLIAVINLTSEYEGLYAKKIFFHGDDEIYIGRRNGFGAAIYTRKNRAIWNWKASPLNDFPVDIVIDGGVYGETIALVGIFKKESGEFQNAVLFIEIATGKVSHREELSDENATFIGMKDNNILFSLLLKKKVYLENYQINFKDTGISLNKKSTVVNSNGSEIYKNKICQAYVNESRDVFVLFSLIDSYVYDLSINSRVYLSDEIVNKEKGVFVRSCFWGPYIRSKEIDNNDGSEFLFSATLLVMETMGARQVQRQVVRIYKVSL